MRLLLALLRRYVSVGGMTVIGPDGQAHQIGDCSGKDHVTIKIHSERFARQMALNPGLQIGEGYMRGDLTIENGASLWDMMELYGKNYASVAATDFTGLRHRADQLFRRISQFNFLSRSRRNVAHHYDLSSDLYELFLDKERNYSCAYFEHPDQSLEEAQAAKKRHIAAKLDLKDGQKVLDIGCGWGGMSFCMAAIADVEVTGVTLSEEQHKLATERAAQLGLSDRVKFHLRDYRHVEDKFDRIVSIGMFEHVGTGYYQTYFDKVYDLLTDDGVALIHSIGRRSPPGYTPQFLRKYIFPGGYVPSLSEVFPATERAGLWVTDVEVLRIHYAETLRHWAERFEAKWDEAAALYDETFCRMWEFYLRSCEAEFRFGNIMVFQMQLTKSINALPVTRDYISERERLLPKTNAV